MFTINKYGTERTFHIGQKVKCIYYHEYPQEMDRYRRPWWQFFDKLFHPVKYGVITGNAGWHHYWQGNNKMEQYLFVKIKGYIFDKAIPISCLEDAEEAAKKMERFLNDNIDKLGEKGYSFESFDTLHKGLIENKKFIQ